VSRSNRTDLAVPVESWPILPLLLGNVRVARDSLAEGVADEMGIYRRCPREPLCPTFINPKQGQDGTIPRGAANRLRMKLFLREQSYHHLAVPVS